LFKVVLRVCFTTICKETRAMFSPGLLFSRLCSFDAMLRASAG
jgi:hypothetical protein